MNDEPEAIKLMNAARLNLSLILCNSMKYNEAIDQATKVLTNSPENVKALFRRATAQFKKGDLHSAKDDLKLAYKLDPANKGLMKLFKKVKKGLRK